MTGTEHMMQSLKVVVGSSRWRSVVSCAIVLAGAAPASQAATRYAVTTDAVITAMGEHHLPVENAQVVIAAAISAAVQVPQLDVKSMSMLNEHKAQLLVTCRNAGECLPFYATATWPQGTTAVVVPAELLSTASKAKAASNKDHVATTLSSDDKLAGVRAGSTAMLVIDDNRVHIRVKVVCLQGGGAGDKVRVSTPDHKQAYVGEIVSATLLKGSL